VSIDLTALVGSTEFSELSKPEQAEVLVWALFLKSGQPVSVAEISAAFFDLHLPRPNPTRIKEQLTKSRQALSAGGGKFKPSMIFAKACAGKFAGALSVELQFHSDSIARPPHTPEAAHQGLPKMVEFYAYLYLLENSIRGFIDSRLAVAKGADWWEKVASTGMKKKHEDRKTKEEQNKWAPARSEFGPLYSIDWPDLITIVRKEHQIFSDKIPDIGFLHRFEDLGHYRNIVAHNGVLEDEKAIERVKIYFADWIKQLR
jgi:Swt1-like HEPN